MLNRFRNAIYGPSGSSDDSTLDDFDEYKDTSLGGKIRGALIRSVSFREDLTGGLSRSREAPVGNGRVITENNTNNNNNNNTSTNGSRLSSASSATATTGDDGQQQQQHDKTSQSSRGQAGNVREEDLHSRLQIRAGVVRNGKSGDARPSKFRYTRPEFLQLRTDDEIMVSADHQIRPIILPRDVSRLPWKSGYAECINAGKSPLNEDQASCHQDVLVRKSALLGDPLSSDIRDQIPWTYFGLFDGHAGTAVAIAAAAQLHAIIGEKLAQIADLLVALEFDIDDYGEYSASETSEEEDEEEEDEESEFYDDDENCERNDEKREAGVKADEEADEADAAAAATGDEFKDCSSSPGEILTPAAEGGAEGPGEEPPSERPLESGRSCDTVNKLQEAGNEATQKAPASKSAALEDEQAARRRAGKRFSALVGRRPEALAYKRFRALAGQRRQEERRRRRLQKRCRENACLASMEHVANWEQITVDTLVTGTLEAAFWEMDALIASDKRAFNMAGGCTAIASVFILGKLFVCNAGDSRAIVYKNKRVLPMSFDFTPTSERKRILRLGQQRPELMGNEFTHLEFAQRPTRKDLGEPALYRDAYMTGWSLKTIAYNDLKFPLVYGEGKRSRVLATIGVTRGFGDHELRSQFGLVPIKPFLTPEPEVRALDLEHDERLTLEDVLIMGTDGLWDVTQNEEAARILRRSFDLFADNEESRAKYRYITAAQDLVIHARGHTNSWNNVWRMAHLGPASLDDISAFVVPLKPYRDEYLEWRRLRTQAAAAAAGK